MALRRPFFIIYYNHVLIKTGVKSMPYPLEVDLVFQRVKKVLPLSAVMRFVKKSQNGYDLEEGIDKLLCQAIRQMVKSSKEIKLLRGVNVIDLFEKRCFEIIMLKDGEHRNKWIESKDMAKIFINSKTDEDFLKAIWNFEDKSTERRA